LTPAITKKRKRKRIYDYRVFTALKGIWIICGRICGKRLAPYLKEYNFPQILDNMSSL